MSKVIRKGEEANIVAFELSDLNEKVKNKGASAIRKDAFSPSFAQKEVVSDFIPGGFDFDFQGGMSREEIEKQSTKEGEAIIKKANDEAETIRATATEDGILTGKQEGYELAKQETLPIIEAFIKLVVELKQVRKDFYNNAEEEMVNLVSAVSKEVIGVTMMRDASLVKNVILAAVNQLQNREEMTIVLNTKDLEEAENFRQELSKEVENIDKVTFKGDPLISRGGCMLETNIGSIDARLETQLEAIRETLLATMEEHRAREAGENIASRADEGANQELTGETPDINEENQND